MTQREGRWPIVDGLVVAGLIAVAVREGLRVTTGLHVPPDPDLFRDAAQAQTMADGAWGADPFFAGERLWYNPLVPALVAALHLLTGAPILDLYARGGVVLNLLGPTAFWALARAVFGSGAAATATFAFLFLSPRDLPGWSAAGYWPWLFAGVFTQAIFYAGLIVADRAGQSSRAGWWLLAGLALGVAFLGHTTPALLLGGVLALTAVRMWREGCSAGRSALMFAACLVVAGLVSLPLTIPVVAHYRLAVVNSAPAAWTFAATEPSRILDLLGDHVTAGGALALLGLGLLAVDRERRARARVIGRWALVNSTFLLLHYAAPLLNATGLRVPPIVPAFHFLFYGEAILALLAGYALWRIVEGSARRLARGRASWMTPALASRLLLAALLLWTVPLALPHRRARQDFGEARDRALRYQEREADGRARNWIRAHTAPGSVFLSSDLVSLYVVGPAGGKVVALEAVYANSYVRVADRESDRRSLLERIAENDRAGFCALAAHYRVDYVVADSSRPVEPAVPSGTFLEEAHAAGDVRIWRAAGCDTGDVR